jgi:hypothetical protein
MQLLLAAQALCYHHNLKRQQQLQQQALHLVVLAHRS